MALQPLTTTAGFAGVHPAPPGPAPAGMRWNATTGAYEPIPGAVQAPDTSGIVASPTGGPTKVVDTHLAIGAPKPGTGAAPRTLGSVLSQPRGAPPPAVPAVAPPPSWDEAARTARDRANLATSAYDAAVPRTAPQASQVTVGPAAQAGPVTVGQARDAVAPTVQRATVGTTAPIEAAGVERAQVGSVAPMQAAGMDRAVVGGVERVQAAGVERAGVNATENITAANINRGEDQQTREQQQLSIKALQDAAAGRVPSAAENQMKLASDRLLKQSYAAATALQGGNSGSALRAAQKGGEEGALNIAAETGALRAKEQADARGMLASTLSQVRGQDIGVNTEQAKLTQEANVRNQAAELATKLAQGEIDNKTFMLASTNLQNSRIANQQMELGRALAQGEIDQKTFSQRSAQLQEANKQNQATELQRALAQGDIDQKTFALASTNLQNARVANQQAELSTKLAQGQIDKDTFIQQSQLLFDASRANQAADVTTNVAQANVSTTIATSNAAETNKVAIAQAGLDKDVNVANSMRAIDQMHLDDTRKAELGRVAIESAKVVQSAIAGRDDAANKAAHVAILQRQLDQAQEGMKNAKDAAERQFWAGIIASVLGAGGTLGAAIASKPGQRSGGLDGSFSFGSGPTGNGSDPLGNDPSYGGDIGGSGLSGTDIYNGVGGTNPGTSGSDPTAPWDPYAESDIRSKKNIKPGTAAIEELCNQLEEQLFEYKNPGKHGEGQRIGTMAQDAQKSPMGREFVVDGETLKLDVANALGAALASAANNHRRLKKLEGRGG